MHRQFFSPESAVVCPQNSTPQRTQLPYTPSPTVGVATPYRSYNPGQCRCQENNHYCDFNVQCSPITSMILGTPVDTPGPRRNSTQGSDNCASSLMSVNNAYSYGRNCNKLDTPLSQFSCLSTPSVTPIRSSTTNQMMVQPTTPVAATFESPERS